MALQTVKILFRWIWARHPEPTAGVHTLSSLSPSADLLIEVYVQFRALPVPNESTRSVEPAPPAGPSFPGWAQDNFVVSAALPANLPVSSNTFSSGSLQQAGLIPPPSEFAHPTGLWNSDGQGVGSVLFHYSLQFNCVISFGN